jgi:hypothetical protein
LESTSSPRKCTSEASPAVRNCFKCPLQSLFFSFRSLQTVWALVMRFGAAADAGDTVGPASEMLVDMIRFFRLALSQID